jgi:hypothetical protein
VPRLAPCPVLFTSPLGSLPPVLVAGSHGSCGHWTPPFLVILFIIFHILRTSGTFSTIFIDIPHLTKVFLCHENVAYLCLIWTCTLELLITESHSRMNSVVVIHLMCPVHCIILSLFCTLNIYLFEKHVPAWKHSFAVELKIFNVSNLHGHTFVNVHNCVKNHDWPWLSGNLYYAMHMIQWSSLIQIWNISNGIYTAAIGDTFAITFITL